jgi:putative membrane protein
MQVAANIMIGLVAAIHAYILVLEMFLWTTPRGRKAFGLTADFAKQTAVMGANQGLYNGFLAAGLVWALIAGGTTGYQFAVFFLICVMIAGLYGAATAGIRILFVQTVPAAIGLTLAIMAP